MAFQPTRGSVPHFSMKPHPLLTAAIFLTLITGGLLAMSFFAQEDGAGRYRHFGIFTLVVTGLLTFFLLILATSKMWFPHLWKKNSTHNRHKQHSSHHPENRNRNPHGGRR